jgi:hypothetical protein
MLFFGRKNKQGIGEFAGREERKGEKKGEGKGEKEKYKGKERWNKEKGKGKNEDVEGGRGEKKREQVLNLFYLVV